MVSRCSPLPSYLKFSSQGPIPHPSAARGAPVCLLFPVHLTALLTPKVPITHPSAGPFSVSLTPVQPGDSNSPTLPRPPDHTPDKPPDTILAPLLPFLGCPALYTPWALVHPHVASLGPQLEPPPFLLSTPWFWVLGAVPATSLEPPACHCAVEVPGCGCGVQLRDGVDCGRGRMASCSFRTLKLGQYMKGRQVRPAVVHSP